jgi:hypothetical protein
VCLERLDSKEKDREQGADLKSANGSSQTHDGLYTGEDVLRKIVAARVASVMIGLANEG